jgi:pre-rRNA-processing protein TSR1
MPALERFAKYRGLKSFRSSPWNPYENLPPEYGRIFQFQNFKKSKKMAFETLKDGIPAGTLVTITLNNVPKLHSGIISSFQLLPNEQKLTVSHFSVQRNKEYQEPIKSKDKLIMFSGFRRYVVSPIYTLHERGGSNNVHKFARFMDHGRPHVGTVYAPTQYGPAPVLLFQYTETATWTPGSIK